MLASRLCVGIMAVFVFCLGLICPAFGDDRAVGRVQYEELPIENPAGNQWLILIGIDDYQNNDFVGDLKCCRSDLTALKQLLQTRFGFRPEFTIELYDDQATRSNVESTMYRLVNDSIQADDAVIIAYAGHGYFNETSKLGYWYPVDAAGPWGGVPNSVVRDWCRAMRAKKILVIADSCFSASLLTREGFQPDALLKSRELLAAGGLHPVADAGSPDSRHSIFNHYLRWSLERLADKGKPFATTDVYVELYKPVITNSDQVPAKGAINGTFHEGGQFLFYPVAVGQKVASAVVVKPTLQAPRPSHPSMMAMGQRPQENSPKSSGRPNIPSVEKPVGPAVQSNVTQNTVGSSSPVQIVYGVGMETKLPKQLNIQGIIYNLNKRGYKVSGGDEYVKIYGFGNGKHDIVLLKNGTVYIFYIGAVKGLKEVHGGFDSFKEVIGLVSEIQQADFNGRTAYNAWFGSLRPYTSNGGSYYHRVVVFGEKVGWPWCLNTSCEYIDACLIVFTDSTDWGSPGAEMISVGSMRSTVKTGFNRMSIKDVVVPFGDTILDGADRKGQHYVRKSWLKSFEVLTSESLSRPISIKDVGGEKLGEYMDPAGSLIELSKEKPFLFEMAPK